MKTIKFDSKTCLSFEEIQIIISDEDKSLDSHRMEHLKSCDLCKDAIEGMRSIAPQKALEDINRLKKPVKNSSSGLIRTRLLLAAAIALIGIATIFGIYNINNDSPSKLATAYYEDLEMVDYQFIRGKTDNSKIESLIIRAFNNQEFDKVVKLYDGNNSLESHDYNLELIYGVSLFNTGNYKNAEKVLRGVGQKSRIFNEEAKFYLALLYLKNNNILKSKDLFIQFSKDTSGYYHKKSVEILSKIQ